MYTHSFIYSRKNVYSSENGFFFTHCTTFFVHDPVPDSNPDPYSNPDPDSDPDPDSNPDPEHFCKFFVLLLTLF